MVLNYNFISQMKHKGPILVELRATESSGRPNGLPAAFYKVKFICFLQDTD